MHCFRININSLLPKIHEVRSTANITNTLIIGIGENKLDETIWSSELTVDGYDLVRLDQSEKGGGVVCYMLHIVTKRAFAVIPKVFLLKFFLPKSKPVLLGILKRPPDKSYFLKPINVFTETGVSDKQE